MIINRSRPIEYCLMTAMACVAIFSFADMGFLKIFKDPSSMQVSNSWVASRPTPPIIAIHRSNAEVSNAMD